MDSISRIHIFDLFKDAAGNDDPFSNGFAPPTRIGGQITVARLDGIMPINRTGELGKGLS
jgi:hypothetical protein